MLEQAKADFLAAYRHGLRTERLRDRFAAHDLLGKVQWDSDQAAVQAASADDLIITEPRNAATGFAIVTWMANVDAMGTHCSKLPGGTGQRSMGALASWQRSNAPYVDAALGYMSKIEAMIQAKQGDAARKKFRDDRSQEFASATRNTQAVWFPNGTIEEGSCLRLAAALKSGELDLDRSGEFFPILKEIKADMDSSTRTPAP